MGMKLEKRERLVVGDMRADRDAIEGETFSSFVFDDNTDELLETLKFVPPPQGRKLHTVMNDFSKHVDQRSRFLRVGWWRPDGKFVPEGSSFRNKLWLLGDVVGARANLRAFTTSPHTDNWEDAGELFAPADLPADATVIVRVRSAASGRIHETISFSPTSRARSTWTHQLCVHINRTSDYIRAGLKQAEKPFYAEWSSYQNRFWVPQGSKLRVTYEVAQWSNPAPASAARDLRASGESPLRVYAVDLESDEIIEDIRFSPRAGRLGMYHWLSDLVESANASAKALCFGEKNAATGKVVFVAGSSFRNKLWTREAGVQAFTTLPALDNWVRAEAFAWPAGLKAGSQVAVRVYSGRSGALREALHFSVKTGFEAAEKGKPALCQYINENSRFIRAGVANAKTQCFDPTGAKDDIQLWVPVDSQLRVSCTSGAWMALNEVQSDRPAAKGERFQLYVRSAYTDELLEQLPFTPSTRDASNQYDWVTSFCNYINSASRYVRAGVVDATGAFSVVRSGYKNNLYADSNDIIAFTTAERLENWVEDQPIAAKGPLPAGCRIVLQICGTTAGGCLETLRFCPSTAQLAKAAWPKALCDFINANSRYARAGKKDDAAKAIRPVAAGDGNTLWLPKNSALTFKVVLEEVERYIVTREASGGDWNGVESKTIFNTSSTDATAVDPRTGLFNAYIPLAQINANAGQGPTLDLALRYSPLVDNSAGLGDGWALRLSSYSFADKALRLSTGEVIPCEPGVPARGYGLTLKWLRGSLLILFKDGRAEVLSRLASEYKGSQAVQLNGLMAVVPTAETHVHSEAELAALEVEARIHEWRSALLMCPDGELITTQLIGRLGHRLDFIWDPVTEGQARYRLVGVKDHHGELMKASYTREMVKLELWPGTIEATTFELSLSDHLLRGVSHTVEKKEMRTTFGYADDPVNGALLTSVASTGGVCESVQYMSNGLTFEDDKKLTTLPCVATHVLTPGGSQPRVVTGFRYVRDNAKAYRTLVYRSAAEQLHRNEFAFDENHAMVRDVLTVAGCTKTIEHTYLTGSAEHVPASVTVTWKDAEGRSRSVETKTTFDDHGNIVEHTEGKDTTRWEYYTAASSGGDKTYGVGVTTACPSPSFEAPVYVRTETISRLKIKTATVLSKKFFGYVALDRIVHPKADIEAALPPKVLLPSTTVSVSHPGAGPGDGAIEVEVHEYFNTKADALTHGRVKSTTRSIYNAAGTLEEKSKQVALFSYKDDKGKLTCTSTVLSAEKTSVVTEQVVSRYTGRTISTGDALKNRTEFTWDLLGRPTLKKSAAQSPTYAGEEKASYAATHGATTLKTKSPAGEERQIVIDGLGRVVGDWLWAELDGARNWLQQSRVRYDAVGRQIGVEALDHIGGGVRIRHWVVNTYDAWGNVTRRDTSANTSSHETYSPVQMKRVTWQAAAGEVRYTRTAMENEQGVRISQIFAGDGSGEPHGSALSYDEYGRLVEVRDVSQPSRSFTYDAFDRMTSMTVGDVATMWTYPAHTRKDVPTRVAVAGMDVGTQDVDALGRVTRSTYRDLEYKYTYAGAGALASTATLPDGGAIAYTYLPELGGLVSSITVGDIEQTFTYATAGTRTRISKEGSATITSQFDVHERLIKETHAPDTASDVEVSYSPAGLVMSRSDVLGRKTSYGYDRYGRCASAVTDRGGEGEVTTEYNYDAWGQWTRATVTHVRSRSTLVVSREFDNCGREVSREWSQGSKPLLKMTREYLADDRIGISILTKEGVEFRVEGFTYDKNGCLTRYTCTGDQPADEGGGGIATQVFTYDAQGNMTSCRTTRVKDKKEIVDTATYTLVQGRVTKVVHSDAAYSPAARAFAYDEAGRLLAYGKDGDAFEKVIATSATTRIVSEWVKALRGLEGHACRYDGLGRVYVAYASGEAASPFEYQYDPHDQLRRQTSASSKEVAKTAISFAGDKLLRDGGLKLLHTGGGCVLAEHEKKQVWLLTDDMGTPIAIRSMDATPTLTVGRYTPHGRREAWKDVAMPLPGLHGTRIDAGMAALQLGQGYRNYDPANRVMQGPDDWSPFGAGGTNAFTFCGNDPVNTVDPSGHISMSRRLRAHYEQHGWPGSSRGMGDGGLISSILFGAIGVMLAPFTGGGSLFVAAAATGLAVLSAGLGIASAALSDSDPGTSTALGWASLSSGVAFGVTGAVFRTGKALIDTGRMLTAARAMTLRSVWRQLPRVQGVDSFGRPVGANVGGWWNGSIVQVGKVMGPVRVLEHMHRAAAPLRDAFTIWRGLSITGAALSTTAATLPDGPLKSALSSVATGLSLVTASRGMNARAVPRHLPNGGKPINDNHHGLFGEHNLGLGTWAQWSS